VAGGGDGTPSAEVYDEALNRWMLLPCELPSDNYLAWMDSTLL